MAPWPACGIVSQVGGLGENAGAMPQVMVIDRTPSPPVLALGRTWLGLAKQQAARVRQT